MATHETTIHSLPAQGRTISKPVLVEFPKLPTYPFWVLQVASLTNTELSALVDVGRRDGVDDAKSSPSDRKFLKALEQRSLLEFSDRVNLWRLSTLGESIVQMAENAGSDIQFRPARMAKMLQFPSA